ncbi:MAG TPA: sodium:proton antiporter [Bacteroidales bacterium]|nr:sodium:proton antiporter [Bacteroidales bacterium]
MVKNAFIFLILIGVAMILVNLFAGFTGNVDLGQIANHYVANGPAEVGSANIVTAVVVTYRGFDTLGEVTILFLSAAIVGFFLKIENTDNTERNLKYTSEILNTASQVLVPIMILFGVYVFINGHLSPGGGFQGGAIIASGLVLMFIAQPKKEIGHKLINIIESISGVGFVLMGLAGVLFAGGFLDNNVIGLGKFGTLFSAGAIPIIYIFVGLKVGSELTGIALSLKENQNEA